jgi:hypothetical protein
MQETECYATQTETLLVLQARETINHACYNVAYYKR